MPGTSRPANGEGVCYEIGIGYLVGGKRVVNCFELWQGGWRIVERFDTADPDAVRQAGEWALSRPETVRWRLSGAPVLTADDVLRVLHARYPVPA
jgi:hypothetical protein